MHRRIAWLSSVPPTLRSLAMLLLCAGLCAGACLALVRPAEAQPRRERGAKLEREARRHKTLGLEHQKRKQLTRAIEELQISYALYPDSDVLYELAQTYNAKQDYTQALYYYRLYQEKAPEQARERRVAGIIEALVALQSTRAPDGQEEQRPAERSGQTAEEKGSAPGPAETASGSSSPASPASSAGVQAPAAALDSQVDREDAGSGKRLAGLATAALGAAAVGAGLYYAGIADSTSEKFDDGSNLRDEGVAERRNGIILAAAGGAAIVTGTVLYVLGRIDRRTAGHIGAVPLSGRGAALSLSGEF